MTQRDVKNIDTMAFAGAVLALTSFLIWFMINIPW
jgi:hypothetical protein